MNGQDCRIYKKGRWAIMEIQQTGLLGEVTYSHQSSATGLWELHHVESLPHNTALEDSKPFLFKLLESFDSKQ